MLCDNQSALYFETDEVQVLSLKYTDQTFAYNVFLPKVDVGLDVFLAGLTGTKIQELLGCLTLTDYVEVRRFRG